jgi:two-component system cell cycle sensor histidine kinase/response regulator CckA
MGLAVVIGIVRAHEGAIVVESTQDSGSVFRVYMPLTADEPPKLVAKVADASDMRGHGTVLVVDDEDMVRNVGVAMLASFGFAVLAAKNGAEAVEVFRQHADDIRCVVCDLTMPHMDGWATLTAIRRLAPGLPVILASGYSEAQVMDGAHRERPHAYLHKPYSMAALKEAIASAMGGAGSGVERLG